MKQSRTMSLVESLANVVVGYGVAVVTQLSVFPWFGLSTHFSDALAIGAIFTVVSILRSYLLRRAFEAIHSGRAAVRPPRQLLGGGRINLTRPGTN